MESLEQKLRQLDTGPRGSRPALQRSADGARPCAAAAAGLASPAPALDDSQLPSINSSWDIAARVRHCPGLARASGRPRMADRRPVPAAPGLVQQPHRRSSQSQCRCRREAHCAARRPPAQLREHSRSSPSSTRDDSVSAASDRVHRYARSARRWRSAGPQRVPQRLCRECRQAVGVALRSRPASEMRVPRRWRARRTSSARCSACCSRRRCR